MSSRKKLIVLMIISQTLLLMACSNSKSSNTQSYNKNDFRIDVSTVRINSNPETEQEVPSTRVGDTEVITSDTLGELILDNSDNSPVYEINGTDTEYGGMVYSNLETEIEKVDTKYDKTALKNFIVKNYNTASGAVYVNVELDSRNSDYSVTMDEQLLGKQKYEELKSKYNENVAWCIRFTDKGTRESIQIYGCNSYIMLEGSRDLDLTK